jgi:hypothetical protein
MSVTENELRLKFFDFLFAERAGFVSIAWAPKDNKNKFQEKFFAWPDQREIMGAHVETVANGHNVWFSVNMFRRPKRAREFAMPTRLVWADLDLCNPAQITPQPQLRIESSPRRYQAVWRLDELVDPEKAQDLSRRIAYGYADHGADKSGWDIEQLLRVPFTYNYKYDDGSTQVPEVRLILAVEALLPVEVFDGVTEPTPEESIVDGEPLPDVINLPDVQNILYAYRVPLRKTAFFSLFNEEPASDWSAALWHLINVCLEAGMSLEETFAVALESKCNKYERDNRPISYLWKEVVKADLKQKNIQVAVGVAKPLILPTLYEGDPPTSIVDEYKEWAVEATDAVTEYHELSCTMLLSSLMSSGLYLETSFGKVIPNLWGLILGDSTLTRKTTAMKMAMEFVSEIDQELVVATDGSVEGVLTAIASRPGQVSVFFKDEVAGFIDSINRKDYLAGMPETLTQLYDVPEFFTRRLRKETITITKPVFIFFGGGIRDKMYGVLNDEFVLSGFLPRFLIVGGDADLEKIRPAAPLSIDLGEKRRLLRERFTNLYLVYNEETQIAVPDANTSFGIPTVTQVLLNNESWTFFQEAQLKFARAAHESSFQMVAQPTFDRMAWSMLKMAMLYATTDQEPKDETITIKLKHLHTAAYYIQRWGVHTIDLITNVGRSSNQRMVSRIFEHVRRRPGCTRSELSRYHHLNKKELDLILETLLDRGQVRVQKAGSGYTVHPIGE